MVDLNEGHPATVGVRVARGDEAMAVASARRELRITSTRRHAP
jgi:hypothetical protein